MIYMKKAARVIRGIQGKKRKNYSLFVTIIIVGLTVGIGMYMEQINMAYQAYFGEKYGTTILIEEKDGKEIQPKTVENILTLENVIGCDNEQVQNVVYKKEKIPLSLHTSLKTAIKGEKYTVLLGEILEDEVADEIMLNKEMAEKYKIKTGSTLEIDYNNKKYKVHVSGILETNSAESVIYGNYALGKALGMETEKLYKYTIYVNTWKKLKETEKELKSKLDLKEKYIWINSIDNAILGFSGIAGLFTKIVPVMYKIILGSTLIIYFFMIVLWVKAYCIDMGIYVALGLPKPDIVGEMVLRMMGMDVVANLPILIILKLSAKYLVKNILVNLKDFSPSNMMSPMQEIDYLILNSKIPIGALVIKTGIFMLIFSGICTGIVSGVVCMSRTRKLFRETI